MKKELEKNYSHRGVEDRIYAKWLEKGYFHAEVDTSKQPYTIMVPPPNITGRLHMGHAFTTVHQDALIRWKRMLGYNALLLPGTDHASISTELKIVEKLAEEGLTKEELGREEFLRRAWDWKREYGGAIIGQFKKLGASCDWDRERFTMDEGLSDAVLEVFVRLYEKGFIYRGEKLINWCTSCQTTVSDAEVDHEDMDGALWHFKYPISGTDEFLCFATTRPETMLGDTALAVNPKDERYKELVGKTAVVPIVDRVIPIIADDYVDMAYGTGVVKITPAHDPNDYLIGERHNLPMINIMNDDGTLNSNAGRYEGLPADKARVKIIEEFEILGLFSAKEKINHAVGLHERCKHVIEPLLKTQWFVKMEQLAKPAIDAYKNGELHIFPERFGKVYLHWLENIRDWCVSRQLWWGHRIPAYYCADCGEVTISKTAPAACVKCGGTKLNQDEDVLDTWFSSALWPFSTLGWPEKTPELEYFYPTSVLVTGYDILFFWVIRMVFSGIEQMGEIPFKDVLFNGIVRDGEGKKMSKSSGNGLDPLDFIENYGADALRFTVITGVSAGADTRVHMDKFDGSRNFLNKIWNAARFIMMNLNDDTPECSPDKLTTEDKWILSVSNKLCKRFAEHMEGYDLGLAAARAYDFLWDEFCDWYIEMVKPRLYNTADPTRPAALNTLKTVLIKALKLLHPFMPFITEEIFTTIQDEEDTIMLSSFPLFDDGLDFPEDESAVNMIKEAVRAIRAVRLEMNVPPSKKAKIYIETASEGVKSIFDGCKLFFAPLASASEVLVTDKKPEGDAVSAVISGARIFMPFEDLVDAAKEAERLEKEKTRLTSEVARSEKMLANKGFLDRAPESVIAAERKKAAEYKEMLEKINESLVKINI